MLIRRAELFVSDSPSHAPPRVADVRLLDGRIAAIGTLQAEPGEAVIVAAGGCLLPGLHDHHIHLRALAAARLSVSCGPPQVRSPEALREGLLQAARTASPWVRGTGYHESVAGNIDRRWLDNVLPDIPVRIQHRSGRLWILNSAALGELRRHAVAQDDAEALDTASDGRLFDQDHLLSRLRGHDVLPIRTVSRELAAFGITGITDMNPGNDRSAHAQMAAWQSSGDLLQRVHLAGRPELDGIVDKPALSIGPVKVHLHDHDLPELDALTTLIRGAHAAGRPVAVHCVTEVAMVFTLAAYRAAGSTPGDRIEHASITPDALLDDIAELGLIIVTQPNFIAGRGREYLADVPAADHPLLYRCRTFLERGIGFALGSDAPFGDPDPWRIMRAAMHRQTVDGIVIGADERLAPEAALAGFLGEPGDPSTARRITVGGIADLCLLDVPWAAARLDPDTRHVRRTFIAGVPVIT